jgi:hypothetical protein
MNSTVMLQARDFTRYLTFPGVTFTPLRYGFQSVGGPAAATIQAAGAVEALTALLDTCRCAVTIYDERGTPVWWGYVHSVSMSLGTMSIGKTLDGHYNVITAVYSDSNTTIGTYSTSTTLTDPASIAEYGQHAYSLSLGNTNATVAALQAQRFLNEHRHPLSALGGGQGGTPVVTLACRGWWDTLGWRYYGHDSGRVNNAEPSDRDATVGAGDAPHACTVLAQKWAVPIPLTGPETLWTVDSVEVLAGRVGAPGDNLVVTICADYGGVPGAPLVSGTVVGSALPTSPGPVVVQMAGTLVISYSATYWIYVTRSGAVDAANYFIWRFAHLTTYTSGYGGVGYNTTEGWAGTFTSDIVNTPAFIFAITGATDTTDQALRIVSDYAQYFTGTDVDAASGVLLPPYRDGKTTHLAEMEGLLSAGTANHRRLLATVAPSRRVRFYEEPNPEDPAEALYLDARSGIYSRNGVPVAPQTCPCARWVRIADLGLVRSTAGDPADPAQFFIDEIEYDCNTGTLQPPRARGVPDPFRLGRIQS